MDTIREYDGTGRRDRMWWVVATIGGWLVVKLVLSYPLDVITRLLLRPSPNILMQYSLSQVIISILLDGFGVGLGQWVFWHRRRLNFGWWIPAVILSFATGLGGVSAFSMYTNLLASTSPSQAFRVVEFGRNWIVPIFCVSLALSGIPQWLVLRRHFSQSGWWALSVSIGLLAALLAMILRLLGGGIAALLGVIAPAVYGAITGKALVRLLQRQISLPERLKEV